LFKKILEARDKRGLQKKRLRRIAVNVEVVTNIMIQNPKTNEVVIQNRKKKYPGWSFPGGHVENGESVYDCAVRETKEETGLDVSNLNSCGILHWINRETDERYICFMYKTTDYSGDLTSNNDEGEYFWIGLSELFAAPKEKISCGHYVFSPLYHEYGRYSEAVIYHSGDESTWEVCYK
jgi:8-oxo-dGTP diphosphatase